MFSQSQYESFYLAIGRIWELILSVLSAMYMKDDDDDGTRYIFHLNY